MPTGSASYALSNYTPRYSAGILPRKANIVNRNYKFSHTVDQYKLISFIEKKTNTMV